MVIAEDGALSEERSSLESQPSLLSLPSLSLHLKSSLPSLCECISTLKGHSSYVSGLVVLRNSLYSGSSDGQIQIWTTTPSQSSSDKMYQSSHQVIDCKSAVKSLVISGDNLFSSHQDHRIRVWRINRHHRLRSTLPTCKDRLLSFLSPPGKHVEVRGNKTPRTWGVCHADVVSGLAISGDGSHLYSVSWDRALKAWRTSDFKCTVSIPNAHHDAINAVAVSKDGFIYTGSADMTVKVWKKLPSAKNNISLVATLERHKSAVNALALSTDGTVLYSGACDRSVVVWEGGGGRMEAVGALRGHTKAILCLSTMADLVCSGSADKSVRVWRRGGDKGGGYSCLAVMELHVGPVKSLAMLRVEPCGDDTSTYLVYSGSMDCDVKVWKLLVPPPPPGGDA